jgi:glucose-1-phosphate thymidylyltransferase
MILAAGYATRLYPLTQNFPKPLLEVGKKTILDWLVDDLTAHTAIEEFIVISNHKFAGHFERWALGKQSEHCRITVVDDMTSTNETRLGAVRDIQYALDKLNVREDARDNALKDAPEDLREDAPDDAQDEDVREDALEDAQDIQDDILIMAGDNVLNFSLAGFVDFASAKGTSCVMCHVEPELAKQQKTAIITLDEDSKIVSYEEKPREPKGNLAVPPFYIYRAQDVRRIPEALEDGCGADAPGSFAAWLSQKVPMHAYVMPGKRYEIGDVESYEYVRSEFAKFNIMSPVQTH